MNTKRISLYFGYARNSIGSDSIVFHVERHYDRNAFSFIVRLVKLSAEWSNLYTTVIAAELTQRNRRVESRVKLRLLDRRGQCLA